MTTLCIKELLKEHGKPNWCACPTCNEEKEKKNENLRAIPPRQEMSDLQNE